MVGPFGDGVGILEGDKKGRVCHCSRRRSLIFGSSWDHGDDVINHDRSVDKGFVLKDKVSKVVDGECHVFATLFVVFDNGCGSEIGDGVSRSRILGVTAFLDLLWKGSHSDRKAAENMMDFAIFKRS